MTAIFFINLFAEDRVTKKFKQAGCDPFPEVDLERAVLVTGISRSDIVEALWYGQLRGRRIGSNDWMIRVIDLWKFAVSFESTRLKNKKIRH